MNKIVQKIAKLLALAEGQGTTPHEAAAAAAQANRLMLKHKISSEQLDQASSDEPIEYKMLHVMGRRTINWRANLAFGLANLHQCRTLTGTGYIKIVGRASDRQIVQYLYVYLSREVERLVREEKNRYNNPSIHTMLDEPIDTRPRGKSWYDSFKKGAVQEILDRLEAEQAQQRDEVSSTSEGTKALVKIDAHDLAVHKVMTKHSSGTRASSFGTSNSSGYRKGKAAGKTVALNKGLSGVPIRRLGSK